MRIHSKAWTIFVLLMIVSAGLLSFWWQDLKQKRYESSLTSSYEYRIELTADSILSNVTLYIPLPVINNTSSVGMDIIEHDFNKGDPSWKYSLVDTKHGLMLYMKNKKVEPQYTTANKYSEKRQRPSIDLSTIVFSNQTIDTMNPVGNALVLMPKYNFTHSTDASKAYGKKDYYRSKEEFDYESRVYAYYETSSNANVSISIYMTGINQWWIGGWLFNKYWENMEIKLSGSQDGWTTVNGELFTGEGSYPEKKW